LTDPGPPDHPGDTAAPVHPLKSRGGWRRILNAAGYSWQGLRAAWRHEAAFRQELLLLLAGIALATWLAPGRWGWLAMVGSLVLVLIVELLNSAVEALADAVSIEHRELLGRAKDIGSAAVMLSLGLAALTWLLVLWH
jgi:diacylglycerol kinase (ATP)